MVYGGANETAPINALIEWITDAIAIDSLGGVAISGLAVTALCGGVWGNATR
jgi:hypothetical protein